MRRCSDLGTQLADSPARFAALSWCVAALFCLSSPALLREGQMRVQLTGVQIGKIVPALRGNPDWVEKG